VFKVSGEIWDIWVKSERNDESGACVKFRVRTGLKFSDDAVSESERRERVRVKQIRNTNK
jgi:hypothetical protein